MMWILFSAILLASLLGSTHCVGMCGPLALWASGSSEQTPRQVAINTTLYHLGRLMTYALMGLLAGAIGHLVDIGGDTIGYRMLAAQVVGGFMVLIGVWRLAVLLSISPSRKARVVKTTSPKPALATRVLIKIRPFVFKLPASAKALSAGILTAFLPCGWLYLFAFVAAGTANALSGVIVMVAFWIGTVPLLTGLIVSASLINTKLRTVVPVVASILLVITGVYTARGNGFASQDALAKLQIVASEREIKVLSDAPLPCCCNGNNECDSP